ncbi:hypothetical protein Tco_0755438 [Tanacetum coccineum]
MLLWCIAMRLQRAARHVGKGSFFMGIVNVVFFHDHLGRWVIENNPRKTIEKTVAIRSRKPLEHLVHGMENFFVSPTLKVTDWSSCLKVIFSPCTSIKALAVGVETRIVGILEYHPSFGQSLEIKLFKDGEFVFVVQSFLNIVANFRLCAGETFRKAQLDNGDSEKFPDDISKLNGMTTGSSTWGLSEDGYGISLVEMAAALLAETYSWMLSRLIVAAVAGQLRYGSGHHRRVTQLCSTAFMERRLGMRCLLVEK